MPLGLKMLHKKTGQLALTGFSGTKRLSALQGLHNFLRDLLRIAE